MLMKAALLLLSGPKSGPLDLWSSEELTEQSRTQVEDVQTKCLQQIMNNPNAQKVMAKKQSNSGGKNQAGKSRTKTAKLT